jgi:N-acetylglucosamine kinase-like BadF-type ATPase
MAEKDLMSAPDTAGVSGPESWGDLTLLGLDIGGTTSRARLWAAGKVVAESRAQSASLPATGPAGATAALAELLAGVRVEQAAPLDAIGVGSAGLSVPGAREFLREHLAPLTRSGELVIVTDAMLVLPAAGLDAGVAVVCGTGSVAVGSVAGRSVQVGGWGYLLGDEGGGYWIVREAMRTLLSRRDLGRPAGELGAQLLSATGAADLPTLHRLFYAQPHLPGSWARHAGLVLDSADSDAVAIAARAAEAVAGLAASAIQQLDSPVSLPVVLSGGLLANAAFRDAARNAVAQVLPGADVRVLADEPVAGAVRLAALAATQNGQP